MRRWAETVREELSKAWNGYRRALFEEKRKTLSVVRLERWKDADNYDTAEKGRLVVGVDE